MGIVAVMAIVMVAVLGIGAAIVLATYNGFVRSRLRSREAWSTIDIQLRRRASLIPNLVETVRGYANHERETLEAVIRARGALQQANGAVEAAGANNMLTQALGRLFAVSEQYPQLRAADNFMALQRELSDVEEKIAYARQFYNQNVLDFNTRSQMFPQSVIAGLFHFQPLEFFEPEGGRDEVKVDFTK